MPQKKKNLFSLFRAQNLFIFIIYSWTHGRKISILKKETGNFLEPFLVVFLFFLGGGCSKLESSNKWASEKRKKKNESPVTISSGIISDSCSSIFSLAPSIILNLFHFFVSFFLSPFLPGWVAEKLASIYFIQSLSYSLP